MGFLFDSTVMKVFAGLTIPLPHAFRELSIDRANIFGVLTSTDDEKHQQQCEVSGSGWRVDKTTSA
jgi:hypothetical protein